MLVNKPDKQKFGIFKIIKNLFPIVFASAPILFSLTMVSAILHGASWGVITMMQQRFFDQAALLVSNNTSLDKVAFSFMLLGFAYLLCNVLNGADNFIRDISENKIKGKLSLAIHKKVARLSPADFEDTSKLDNLNKAEEGKNNAVIFAFDFISIFTFYLPYFLFMGWYLFSFKPILAVSIILIFTPTALAQVIRSKVYAKIEDKSAPVRREYEYYEECIAGREYYKETRFLGGFAFFNKLYLETLDILKKIKYKAAMKTNLIELAMQTLTVVGYFGVILMLFHLLMNQEISIGVFSAVFDSIGRLYGMMYYVVSDGIGDMAKNAGTIENYLKFLEMDERKSELDVKPEWGDISLENVSFSYPNSEAYAVKNANFTLMNGETIAIVGENGSGKSTLVRLLDEPTAAIDPYEETRIYNRFAEISKDKSAIIVTHRLGAAKIADRIVVMKDGEIEEIGTHDELIQARKEYTRLYTYQEQWYS